MEDYAIFEIVAGVNLINGASVHIEVFNSECVAWMGKDYVLLTMQEKLEFQRLCQIR